MVPLLLAARRRRHALAAARAQARPPRSRALTVVLAVTVAFGYTAGLFHRLPEYLLAGGLVYLVACVVFHLRTR